MTTLITGGLAIATMYVNFKVSEADMQSKLKIHDNAISQLQATQQRIVDNQQQQTLTEQKLVITMDYLAKQMVK